MEEKEIELKDLQDALDESSRHNRRLFLLLLVFLVYALVTVASTSDIQLLRPYSNVKLPVVNVELPLFSFYVIAPLFILVFHFNLLFNLLQHSRKLYEWDRRRDRKETLLMFPFLFNYLVQYRKGNINSCLLRMITWAAVFFLPLAILLYIQIKFSAYHSLAITSSHFATLMADVLLIFLYWNRITGPELSAEEYDGFKKILLFHWEKGFLGFIPRAFHAVKGGLLLVARGESFVRVLKFPLVLLWNANRILRPRTLLHVARYLFANLIAKIELLSLVAIILVSMVNFVMLGLIMNLSIEKLVYIDDEIVPIEAAIPGLKLHEKALFLSEPGDEVVQRYLEQGKTRDDAWLDFTRGLDLRGRDLRFADFSKSKLLNADLREADLQWAVLAEVNLLGADLRGSNLLGTTLYRARMQKADVRGANLQRTYLEEADLQDVDLRKAYMAGVLLNEARLHKVDLSEANLRAATLKGAKAQEVTLSGADMRLSSLKEADMRKADFRKAQLQGADLSGANLQGADLREANLQGAILTEANLQGADLRGANLQLADLRGAGLQGADLEKARLQGACLEKARLQAANLKEARLQITDLKETDFQGAYLGNAGVRGADFDSANLRGVLFDGLDMQSKEIYWYWDGTGAPMSGLEPSLLTGEMEELSGFDIFARDFLERRISERIKGIKERIEETDRIYRADFSEKDFPVFHSDLQGFLEKRLELACGGDTYITEGMLRQNIEGSAFKGIRNAIVEYMKNECPDILKEIDMEQ